MSGRAGSTMQRSSVSSNSSSLARHAVTQRAGSGGQCQAQVYRQGTQKVIQVEPVQQQQKTSRSQHVISMKEGNFNQRCSRPILFIVSLLNTT